MKSKACSVGSLKRLKAMLIASYIEPSCLWGVLCCKGWHGKRSITTVDMHNSFILFMQEIFIEFQFIVSFFFFSLFIFFIYSKSFNGSASSVVFVYMTYTMLPLRLREALVGGILLSCAHIYSCITYVSSAVVWQEVSKSFNFLLLPWLYNSTTRWSKKIEKFNLEKQKD